MHTKNAWVSLIGLIMLAAIIIGGLFLMRPTNEPIMLTVQAVNKDIGADNEDYWAGSTQTVYYNGKAEYFDEYHLTGKKNKESWKLDEDVLTDIKILLDRINVVDNETMTSGILHIITYYKEDGTVVFQYSGSIDSNTFSRIVYQIVP